MAGTSAEIYIIELFSATHSSSYISTNFQIFRLENAHVSETNGQKYYDQLNLLNGHPTCKVYLIFEMMK